VDAGAGRSRRRDSDGKPDREGEAKEEQEELVKRAALGSDAKGVGAGLVSLGKYHVGGVSQRGIGKVGMLYYAIWTRCPKVNTIN